MKYANQMIAKDIRANGEFYVCPVYNEAIADGQNLTVPCGELVSLMILITSWKTTKELSNKVMSLLRMKVVQGYLYLNRSQKIFISGNISHEVHSSSWFT